MPSSFLASVQTLPQTEVLLLALKIIFFLANSALNYFRYGSISDCVLLKFADGKTIQQRHLHQSVRCINMNFFFVCNRIFLSSLRFSMVNVQLRGYVMAIQLSILSPILAAILSNFTYFNDHYEECVSYQNFQEKKAIESYLGRSNW